MRVFTATTRGSFKDKDELYWSYSGKIQSLKRLQNEQRRIENVENVFCARFKKYITNIQFIQYCLYINCLDPRAELLLPPLWVDQSYTEGAAQSMVLSWAPVLETTRTRFGEVVSCLATPSPSSPSVTSAGRTVLKALEKSNNMILSGSGGLLLSQQQVDDVSHL